MKKAFILFIILLPFLFAYTNKEEKLFKEYQELIDLYPNKFGNGNAAVVYNKNKEYIFRPCYSREGFGIEIIDLSKLNLEGKINYLNRYKHENIGTGAQYEWINNYVHEAIDNYQNYGESFLLLIPSSNL